MNRAETGRRGEAAAARWYQKQGAQLLAHNYHTRMGELDIVPNLVLVDGKRVPAGLQTWRRTCICCWAAQAW